MPSTTTAKKSTKKTEEVVATAAPVVAATTPAKKSTKKSPTAAPAQPAEVKAAPVAKEESTPASRVRRVVTRESFQNDFDELVKTLEEEVKTLRQSTEKTKGVKFLRSHLKRLKTLKNDSLRVTKSKQRSNRPRNTNSGFMKPVKISPEMASFTGFKANELHSRNEITKFICDYVKSHNLQNPEDRRRINCDDKLKALLKYDADNVPLGKDGKPAHLTYFRLQQYMQPHFISS